jgi:hypothetical protein
MPLFNSVAKRKLFLSIKLTGGVGGAFTSPFPPSYAYADDGSVRT